MVLRRSGDKLESATDERKEMEPLTLYGMWASPFCMEVEIALKLKGVPFEYKHEDLQHKSVSLLEHNPVYRAVPVLVHDGKAVVESLVILEYIEETWNSKDPPLLPTDPYEKARVRFWLKFFYEKYVPPCRSILVTEGEEQGVAINETKEQLQTFEEGIKKEFASGTPFFHGATPGLLDIVLGSNYCWIRLLGEVTGVELMSKETTPHLYHELEAFEELPVVKECRPAHDRLAIYAHNLRKNVLGPNM